MPTPHYERLSTLDSVFLQIEDHNAHMHVGSVSRLDATPFQKKGGGLDFDRIERAMMQILPLHPRMRQKVWWPPTGAPVWVDDPGFDPTYHFRRAALPSPGTDRELARMVSHILSSRLDVQRPLWEVYVIEGVQENRFAIAWKIHHCLADGESVRDILIGYMGFQPSIDPPPIEPFVPRPHPSVGQLRFDNALRRLESSREGVRRVFELFEGATIRSAFADVASGLAEAGANLLRSVSPTPLNGEIAGPRRFEWTRCDFGTLREIRKQADAKINDVVLATVCGAIRRFLLKREVPVDELDFRVMCPVSMRSQGIHTPGGNQVSNMVVPLPLFETDPKRRLRAVADATSRAKASGQIGMGDALLHAIDGAGIQLPMPLARYAARQLPANLVVTNIPGPQMPQYLLEAELLDSFPVVPLSRSQGLGIALYSYNGAMHWGLNADRELLPDLSAFVDAVDTEIRQLADAHAPIQVRARPKLASLPGRRGSTTPRATPAPQVTPAATPAKTKSAAQQPQRPRPRPRKRLEQAH